MNDAEYAACDATELTQLIGRGQVTAEEVREATLRANRAGHPDAQCRRPQAVRGCLGG
jgi:hypothetical protein